jgi:hypothetical protein
VDSERLFDGRVHRQPGVERLVGILVHDLHVPPQRPQLALAGRGDLPAAERDSPADGLDES